MEFLSKAPTPRERQKLRTSLAKRCSQAAVKIAEADFILIATGAGFSADSGLAVYKDIADIPAYHEQHLDYHDLCQPHWLAQGDESNVSEVGGKQISGPDLFYGFWGSCFNDYRDTKYDLSILICYQYAHDAAFYFR